MVDTDKLVSVKGLVIRATPVIPDMSQGKLHGLSESSTDIQASSDAQSANIPTLSILTEERLPNLRNVLETSVNPRGQCRLSTIDRLSSINKLFDFKRHRTPSQMDKHHIQSRSVSMMNLWI